MNILIANYRTIRSAEVTLLAAALAKKHKVTIACMATESSYRGLAFQHTNDPTRVSQVYGDKIAVFDDSDVSKLKCPGYEFYSNPADMISIMLGEIMRHATKPQAHRPDLVICGIGNGVNLGPDIYSSSMIGMAFESTFFGVPAIVVSTEHNAGGNSPRHIKPVVQFIEKQLEKLAAIKLPPQTFLNINLPRVESYKEFKGIKTTRMGKMDMKLEYTEKTDPKGHKYFWAKRATRDNDAECGNDDRTWHDKGYVTVTPINYDATDRDAIKQFGCIDTKLKRK